MLPRRSAIFLGLAGLLLAGVGVFGWDGSKWWRVRVDQNSQSVVSIQEVHHHIHDGDHFFVGGYDSLDNGDTTEFVIDTPATGEIHMEFAYSSNKASVGRGNVHRGHFGGPGEQQPAEHEHRRAGGEEEPDDR